MLSISPQAKPGEPDKSNLPSLSKKTSSQSPTRTFSQDTFRTSSPQRTQPLNKVPTEEKDNSTQQTQQRPLTVLSQRMQQRKQWLQNEDRAKHADPKATLKLKSSAVNGKNESHPTLSERPENSSSETEKKRKRQEGYDSSDTPERENPKKVKVNAAEEEPDMLAVLGLG
jgi:hypothetical protein